MDYKTMTIEDIINWCKENNEVAWLKAKAKETVTAERYTRRVKTINAKGKEVWVADKTSPKEKFKMPISYVQIKVAFCEKFMPEIMPNKKDKEPTMYDRIAAL